LKPVFAVCICAPGVDMITMLAPQEIEAGDHLRHPSARQHAERLLCRRSSRVNALPVSGVFL
jgi:hypothetical protein